MAFDAETEADPKPPVSSWDTSRAPSGKQGEPAPEAPRPHKGILTRKRLFDSIGMACYIAWSIVFWNGSLLFGSDYQIFSFGDLFVFQSLFTALAALLITLSAPKISSLRSSRALLVVFAVVSSAGVLVTALAGYGEGSSSVMILGFAMSGLGSTLRLGWEERLSVPNVKATAICIALAYAFGFVLFAVIVLLPPVAAIAVTMILPFVACVMLIAAEKKDASAFQPAAPGRGEALRALFASVPLKYIVVIALAYFGYGATRTTGVTGGLSVASTTSEIIVGSGPALACIIAIGLAYAFYRKNALLAFYIAFPLMAFASLLPASISPLAGPTTFYVSLVGAELVKYVVWFLLIGTITKDGTSALFCLGLMRFAQWGGSCLGQVSADALPTQEAVTIAILVCLIAALLIMIGTPVGKGGSGVVADREDEIDALQTRALAVARRYKLSPRETEVFNIWITGRSGPYIEKTLYISKNTVKTHLNHIYAKTKTANREELLELIDSEKPEI